MRDFALQGHRWGSLILRDGSARTMLAGAVAPSEANWGALTLLSPAWQRYGVPGHVMSASGGACIADAFAGVWARLAIAPKTISSTEGQSDHKLLETHGNIQRRVDDSPLAVTRTPREFAEAHQRFLDLSTTTAHQGLRKEHCTPPSPLPVLGESQGRLSPPPARVRTCAPALLVRTTHRYGGVTLHRSHCSVARGGPQTPVWLWVSGADLRAVSAQVLVAASHGHDDLRTRQVPHLRLGPGYPR